MPKLYINEHDLSIATFSRDCVRYGISDSDLPMFKKIAKIYGDWKKGKIKTRVVEKMDDNEEGGEISFD